MVCCLLIVRFWESACRFHIPLSRSYVRTGTHHINTTVPLPSLKFVYTEILAVYTLQHSWKLFKKNIIYCQKNKKIKLFICWLDAYCLLSSVNIVILVFSSILNIYNIYSSLLHYPLVYNNKIYFIDTVMIYIILFVLIVIL